MTATPELLITPIRDDLLRGALELEETPDGIRPHRLPAWARAQAADAQIAMAEAQPSGMRLVFTTEATTIALGALATRYGYAGAPPRPVGVFDLVVNGHLVSQASLATASTVTIDPATGATHTQSAPPDLVRFDDLTPGAKHIELWLPYNETVDLIALHTDAPVACVPDRLPIWVHYGSSISHGSNAANPTGIWPVIAAKMGGVELTNLGFSGSALLDPFVARIIRDTPADRISLKIGINLVNMDLMRLRAFGPAVHGFLDTIRDGHPTTPLLVISPVLCPIHEFTPGPGAFDFESLVKGKTVFRARGNAEEVAAGKLTLTVIRERLATILAERMHDDANLHYLDGLSLYGPGDADAHPLPDALHPDAATHRLIGERFATLAFRAGSPLTTHESDDDQD